MAGLCRAVGLQNTGGRRASSTERNWQRADAKFRQRGRDPLATAPRSARATTPRHRHSLDPDRNKKCACVSGFRPTALLAPKSLESGLQAVRKTIAPSPDGLKSGLQTLASERSRGWKTTSGAWPRRRFAVLEGLAPSRPGLRGLALPSAHFRYPSRRGSLTDRCSATGEAQITPRSHDSGRRA